MPLANYGKRKNVCRQYKPSHWSFQFCLISVLTTHLFSDMNTIVIILLLQNKTATTLLKLCCQEHRCRMPANLHPANLHLNSRPSTQWTLPMQEAQGKSFYDDQVIYFTFIPFATAIAPKRQNEMLYIFEFGSLCVSSANITTSSAERHHVLPLQTLTRRNATRRDVRVRHSSQ
jgi:hypothetical protein